MLFLSNFDVISDENPFKLEVKDKTNGEIYAIQKICDLSENELATLVKKVNLRKNIIHPNIIILYEHVIEDNNVYLKYEHCQFGALSDFIKLECIDKNRQLHEKFLCRILYQIAFALKTIDCIMGTLDLNTIMLNKLYAIKLSNFDIEANNGKQKEIKLSHLGKIMFHLTTLKSFQKFNYVQEIESINYSNEYKDILISMVKNNSEIKKHLGKILSHPTILLNSTQWTESKCFQNKIIDITHVTKSEYLEKLERIRRKEATLQLKEDMLKEREHKLENKEKKLHIMERDLKDKIQQVELYLKRCREGGKSVTSGSSKTSTNSQLSSKSQKLSYEEMDSTYVSCQASDLAPTSTKLQIEKITKPQNFTRTLSERRITFKTSPLKDRKLNYRRSIRHSKLLEEHINIKSCIKKAPEYQNDLQVEHIKQSENKNIRWTKENKQHAFDMLRFMNSEDKENIEVKHTYL